MSAEFFIDTNVFQAEDIMNHGQEYDGVRVKNPSKPATSASDNSHPARLKHKRPMFSRIPSSDTN